MGGELQVDSANGLADATVVMNSARGIVFNVASPTLGALAGTGAIGLPTGTLTLNTSTGAPTYSGVLSGTAPHHGGQRPADPLRL